MFNWFKNKFKKDNKDNKDKIEEKAKSEIEANSDLKEDLDLIKNQNEDLEILNYDDDNKKSTSGSSIVNPKIDKIEEESKKDLSSNEENIEVNKNDKKDEFKSTKKTSVAKYALVEEPEDRKDFHLITNEKIKDEINSLNENNEMEDTKESAFKRFIKGVNKTRKGFAYKINTVFSENDIDDDFYEELEEILVMGDVGAKTTMTVIDLLKDRIIEKGIHKSSEAKVLLKEIIIEVMNKNIKNNYLDLEPSPAILMLVGVNGVGKTTTCGKLAYQFKKEGKSVAIIAADTFRAAAIEQLEVWSKRAGVHIISQKEGADPAAVVFDGLDYSIKNNIDITIIDTAGRLHNKVNLMNELNKVKRIIDKKMPDKRMEVILALDATTGQNALLQVKEFKEAAGITGVSLNKLDGTAKGGVIIPIQYEEGIPVKIVGVGESIYDLQPFDPELFVNAIFEE